MLSQTGLVGAPSSAAFYRRSHRRGENAAHGHDRSSNGPRPRLHSSPSGLYWFFHSAGDWLWTLPAVTAPAFAWLALAGRIDDGGSALGPQARVEDVAGERHRSGLTKLSAIAVVGLITLIAAASYALPWRAAVEVDRAASTWGEDPAAAFERLDRARD